MEINSTTKETQNPKHDSLEGSTLPVMPTNIENGLNSSKENSSMLHTPTEESKEISKNSLMTSGPNLSSPDIESVRCDSSLYGVRDTTETQKTSSDPSPMQSSNKINSSPDDSTLIQSNETEEESMFQSLSEPKNADAPDLLYILGRGSKWRNNEIRFSLRSVEKNLPHARIFIVGERPKFLKNIVHIPAIDPYDNKLANAVFKLRAACREIDLSEKFILMNDDFFILRATNKIEASILGTMQDAILNHKTKAGYYYQAFRKTKDLLVATGIERPLDYEVHAPMIIEKQKFLEMTDSIEWEEGYLFRSIYGNLYEVGGKKRIDTKVHDIVFLKKLSEGSILSTADRVVLRPEFQRFIYKSFPHPSRYEDPQTDPGILP